MIWELGEGYRSTQPAGQRDPRRGQSGEDGQLPGSLEDPHDGALVPRRHPLEHAVAEGLARLGIGRQRQAGDEGQRQDGGADQSVRHRVGHGGEELLLHALKGEERQIGGDDDQL